jgi:hypothetical protein
MIELGSNREWLGAQCSLPFFTTKFLGLKWHTHYEEWRQILEAEDRLLAEAPRGSHKSFFFSLAYPLWRIIRGTTDILLVSDSEDQARKNLRIIREKVEQTPSLKPLYPSTKELWGVDQAQFPNGSIVNTMGFGTSKRGEHPLLILCDDIESERNKMSREDKNRMYWAVVTGMAVPHTKLALLGTPLEFGDILEQASKRKDDLGKPVYRHWRKPITIDGVNQYPDIWTDEQIRQRKAEMGSIDFAREMMLERIDPETQPFKKDYETLYRILPEKFAYTVTACDPAYTEGDGDYTAIVTVKFTHGNHGYVVDCKRIKRTDPGDIVDELFKTIAAQQPDAVGIPKKKGEAVSYSFNERRVRQNEWGFKYVELPETQGKAHKTRIGGLVPRWEARTIHIHENMKDLLDEIYMFRLDDSHPHDDAIDALAHCFNPEMVAPNSRKTICSASRNIASWQTFLPRWSNGPRARAAAIRRNAFKKLESRIESSLGGFMGDNLEKVEVTYDHEVDGMHGSGKSLDRTVSTKPNTSLPEAADQTGNPGRLKIEYNVGKRPETKNIQSL